MKKPQLSFAAVALSLGLVFAIGGAASAHGNNGHGNHGGGYGYGHGHGHSGSVATGPTTCNIHGRVTISATGSVTISGNITPKHGPACSSTGGTKLKTGHFSTSLTSPPTTTTSTTSTTSTTTSSTTSTTTSSTTSTTTTTLASCPPLATGPLSDVTGGTITWSPRPKVAPSVGVALTSGAISQVLVDGNQFFEIAYTSGSVASGSFATTSGVSLTARSNQTVSELTECGANGSYSFAFRGSLTL